jgi:hypothetical protein
VENVLQERISVISLNHEGQMSFDQKAGDHFVAQLKYLVNVAVNVRSKKLFQTKKKFFSTPKDLVQNRKLIF